MSVDSISNTKLVYLDDTYQSRCTAVVLAVQETSEKGMSVILDQTIFYPQGGGQPADHGEIRTADGAGFVVNDVRMIEGVVHHFGNLTQGIIAAQDKVDLTINIDRRRLHARLHSAGHLIDAAVQQLALSLTPTKGYHFPDGPYVEYLGEIAADERENTRMTLESKVNELINTSLSTEIISTRKAQLLDYCPSIPDYIDDSKPVRVVTMVPKLGCPCGGTHVQNSHEVGKIILTKVRVKGGQTRISYQLKE